MTNVVTKPTGSSVAKAVVMAIAAVLTGVIPFFVHGDHLTAQNWVNVAIVAVGAVAVYFGPNTVYAKYTKAVLATLVAVLTVLSSVIVGGITSAEWLQIALAAVGALGVYIVPNGSSSVVQ